MGCDIHSVFQAKINGKWEDISSEYNEDRHYLLFAWLGNVRNGYGFAGCKTFQPIIPLSDNRGFPDDFEYNDNNEEKWMGDHSFSWLSDVEILTAVPPKIVRSGIITIDEYKKWDRQSPPAEWCGGISGPKIKVAQAKDISDDTTHVEIEWIEDAAESLKYFIDEVRRLHNKYDKVRFVFGFDS